MGMHDRWLIRARDEDSHKRLGRGRSLKTIAVGCACLIYCAGYAWSGHEMSWGRKSFQMAVCRVEANSQII